MSPKILEVKRIEVQTHILLYLWIKNPDIKIQTLSSSISYFCPLAARRVFATR